MSSVPLLVPSFFFNHGGGHKDVNVQGEEKQKDIGFQGEEVKFVCSRRGKGKEQDKDKKQDELPSHAPNKGASLDPVLETCIVPSSNVSSLDISFNDSNVPITIRKGVRSCTQYPISNFFLFI